MADAPLILAVVIGYCAATLCSKWTAKAPAVSTKDEEPEEFKPLSASHGSQAVAALPTEVQAQIAKCAGLSAFAALACTNSVHHHELSEKDSVWAHIAGRRVSAAEFRREAVGLDTLEEHTLNSEDDVAKAEKMLRGARPEDHVDEQFVKMFERAAEESGNLFWSGVGEAGVSLEKLGTAACARTDIFTEEQCDDIARLVGEHEETTRLCNTPVYPEEDFGITVRDDIDRRLSEQFDSMYQEMNAKIMKGF